MKAKRWEVLNKEENIKPKGLSVEKIVSILLANRNLKTKQEIDEFFHGDITTVTSKSVGIDQKQLEKAITRIQKAIENKEEIIVFGDYDVDGITATAIVWETLHALGAKALPYIPSRMEEGYGLSIKGIENCIANQQSQKNKIPHQVRNDRLGLIITVDNGIVANDAVDFANKKGIDVIITDHHTPDKLPDAHAIVHTTKVCGAGVAWILSQEISSQFSVLSSQEKVNQSSVNQSDKLETDKQNSENRQQKTGNRIPNDHLSLVALATIADLVSLTGANRIVLKFGLEELQRTKRPGLLAIFQESQIIPKDIGIYEIGHIIAPRLNAMGRLESAMDSLRLLCTKDRMKAKVLAEKLGQTNRTRQLKTIVAVEHARSAIVNGKSSIKKLLFIANETYEEGVIGLVAGKLVEEFYLPAIVLSKGELVSKASARSIAGFNIIDFIRTSSKLLINAGGHPMAAGFTVQTKNIIPLQKALEELAEKQIQDGMLQRVLRIDCNLPLDIVTPPLYRKIQELGPFGMGNPEPTFVSSAVIQDIKTVGKDNTHLKLKVTPSSLRISSQTGEAIPAFRQAGQKDRHTMHAMTSIDAIGFNLGEKATDLKIGDKVEIVYTIDENEWQGKVSLQLKIKDIKQT